MATLSDALREQIEDLGGSGFALAMQLLRNPDDAADVVQDSLHAALRKQRSFDPSRGDLKPWFLKIVRNRCLDVLRQSRRIAQKHRAVEEAAKTEGRADQRPDLRAQANEEAALVKRALFSMPQDQREIVLLRDYHNLRYAAIAKVLGIPAGTVMSRLHRARCELRKRVEAEGLKLED